MRVLFLYPEVGVGVRWTELLSIGMSSAMLKQNEHAVDLLYYKHPAQLASLEKFIPRIKPDLVVAHVAFDQWPPAARLMREARTFAPGVLFIAAGLYPSLDPDTVVEDPTVNGLVVGENELALSDLAQCLADGRKHQTLPSFWFKTGKGTVVKNAIRPLAENLSLLPFADRTLYDHAGLVRATGGGLPMLAGRGCPHECLFCYMPRLKQIASGKGTFVRFRSPMNVIAETLEVARQTKVEWVNFVDECFPHEVEWIGQFCQSWKTQASLPFRFNAVADRLSLESLKRLREAGCAGIRLGVETGNEKFRARLAGRNLDNARLRDLCEEAQRLGVEVHTFNMTGLPLENPDLAAETVEFNRSLPISGADIAIYRPIPGTRLYEYCREKGYILGADETDFNPRRLSLRLPAIDENDILRTYDEIRALNRELRLRAAPPAPGYADLVRAAKDARVQSEFYPGIDADFFTHQGETRLCLIQAIGSHAALPVQLRPKSLLAFGAALGPVPCGVAHRRPVQIEIAVRQGEIEEIVFVKVLHPPVNRPERGWFDFQLPLFEWEAGPAEILLTAFLVGGKPPGTMCVAWSRPVLIEGAFAAVGAAVAAPAFPSGLDLSAQSPLPASAPNTSPDAGVLDLAADFDKSLGGGASPSGPPALGAPALRAAPAAAPPPPRPQGPPSDGEAPVSAMQSAKVELESKKLQGEIKGLKMELEHKAKRVSELRLRELELTKELKQLRQQKAEWERVRGEMETSMGDKVRKFFKKD